MEQTLTRESVAAAFEAIIAEFGADHRYESQSRDSSDPTMGCYYTLPEKDAEGNYAPACIVGHIIARIEPDVFQTIGALEAETARSCGATTLLLGYWYNWADEDGNLPEDSHTFIDEDEGDMTLLNAIGKAQSRQDRRGTWGEAYAAYLEYIALADSLED